MKHEPFLLEKQTTEDPRLSPSSARVPHLTAAAFCLTAESRSAIERASGDRRLTRVKTEVREGGINQVRRIFEARRTPSLLIIEVATTGEALLSELDALAESCDPDTKVVVIGTANDIALYRTLMERGIAEYLVGPITPLGYVATIQRLFGEKSSSKLGKVYAFMGAKGGVGSSTLAQNVAWSIAEEQASPTLLLDLDFRFGSATVNLDLKPVAGLEKYLADPDKLDAALLDRLILQRGEYLSVLHGNEDMLGDIDPTPEAIERLIEIARASFPHVVVDLPHEWSVVSRETLASADEVILVVSPDLPNLHNARAILQRLGGLRPNDAPPRLIVNTSRMPRRKEILAGKFAKSVGVESCTSIAFDPANFGTASAEGRTLREQAPRSAAQAAVCTLARSLTEQGKGRARRGWLRRLLGFG